MINFTCSNIYQIDISNENKTDIEFVQINSDQYSEKCMEKYSQIYVCSTRR